MPKSRINPEFVKLLELLIKGIRQIIPYTPQGVNCNQYEHRALLFNEMKKILDTHIIDGIPLCAIFDDLILTHILGVFELFFHLYIDSCRGKVHGTRVVCNNVSYQINGRLIALREIVERLYPTYTNDNIILSFALMIDIFTFIFFVDNDYTKWLSLVNKTQDDHKRNYPYMYYGK